MERYKLNEYVRVKKKGLSTYGLTGKVTKTLVYGYPNSVEVYFTNPLGDGKNKHVIISKDNLEKVEGEDINMEKLTGYKAVAVVNQGGIDYHFAIYDDGFTYNPGDTVFVSGDNRIKEISDIISPEEADSRFNKGITAEVISPVILTAYNERLEKRKEALKLKNEMDKKMMEMDKMLKYEMYADKCPEFKKMLEKYMELTS